jgi:hypothetical protein
VVMGLLVWPLRVEQLAAARISAWRNRILSMGEGLAPLTLVISDLVAAPLPARRAASVNSVEALRVERAYRGVDILSAPAALQLPHLG